MLTVTVNDDSCVDWIPVLTVNDERIPVLTVNDDSCDC